MKYETLFLQALLLTIAVEGAVIAGAARFFPVLRRWKIPAARIIGAGIIPSIATLPYLWFVLPAFIASYSMKIVIGEVAIALIETVMLRLLINLPLRHCALLSLLANGASILAGLAVFR
ncbi:MAG: hypothetical protein JW913_20210 [Chitinispirillaceae bacterium]|nr:hypothetical protein [Chitinispirillaceae bacterium]